MPDAAKTTPMMQQYFEVKRGLPREFRGGGVLSPADTDDHPCQRWLYTARGNARRIARRYGVRGSRPTT